MVGALLLLVSLPFFVLCSAFGRALGRTRMRIVRFPATRGAGFAWKELVSTRTDRPLIGLVQTPRYLQVLIGRLSLVGDAPIHSGCQDDDAGEEIPPAGQRPGLIRSEPKDPASARSEIPVVDSDLDVFLSRLPSLLLGRSPHWSSRE